MTDSPSLVNAVTISTRSGQFGAGDKAVVALAKRYAQLIEDAQAKADAFDELEFEKPSQSMYLRLQRLEAKVNVATVAADLGPKLLAALDALGLSPAARAKATKGGTPDVPSPGKPADSLAGLRAEHDELAARRTA